MKLSEEQKNLPVLISRQPGGNSDEITLGDIIGTPRWDDVSGGYQKKHGAYGLYGYISYELAASLPYLDCSGRHTNGSGTAKVYIIKPRGEERAQYRTAYAFLCDVAGEKPESKIAMNRPENGGACTTAILKLLQERGTTLRGVLYEALEDEGYAHETISGALWRMKSDGRIKQQGSPQSPKQQISITETP